MLMVSVLMEYDNLAPRLASLENNIDIALSRSIDAATASEELFSAEYQENKYSEQVVSSQGRTPTDRVGANVTICGTDGVWFDTSAYILAMFYETKGRLPKNQSDYATEAVVAENNPYVTRSVYTWLFGQAGHNYNHYDWCNNNISMMNALDEANVPLCDRKPTTEFKKFYDKIGKSIVINGVVKQKVAGGDNYTTVKAYYPVLDNMGLDFNDAFTGDSSNGGGIEADYMTDNFCMTEHAGKKIKGNRYTVYYLTPYSLGVTYIPIKVLKPVFMANLDTIAHLQKVSSVGADTTNAFRKASQCEEPSVYVGTSFTQAQHHSVDPSKRIATDGTIEYELDSTQMRIEYFTANLYKDSYKNVAARIEGCMTGKTMANQNAALIANVAALRASDTAKDGNNNGNRIVAKVTVRVKVHILYQSSILQWLSYKDWLAAGATGEWHAAIKEIDPSTGLVVRDGNDGTWYETSTYFAVTR